MSLTNGTRAVVLTALMVVSVAAVGFAATGAMAQQGGDSSGDEIDLTLTSTQPNSPTGITGLGAIDGSNVLEPQVPGNNESGKVKALKITSGGGLDFSELALIPVPTSGIDRNGDESGTATDVNLVLNLAGAPQAINNGSGLLIKFRDPVTLSVGDEIVVDISEANGVTTGPEGRYTLKTTGITVDGQETTPATAEYTIGNPAPATKNVTINGSGEYTAYSFGSNGSVSFAEEDAEDSINNGTATGAVGPDSDTYTITGSLDDLSVAGNATVTVDGEQVDPSNYDSDVNPVTIKGTGNYASYNISASDSVLQDGIYLDQEDSSSGSQAQGAVTAGQDTFFVDGNVSVSTNGDATVVKS